MLAGGICCVRLHGRRDNTPFWNSERRSFTCRPSPREGESENRDSILDGENSVCGLATQRLGGEPNGPLGSYSTTFVCSGPHKGRGRTKWPTETALTPSSRVCPDLRLGSASCGPWPNGHEEHLWRVDPTPSTGVRTREQGIDTEDLALGTCEVGRNFTTVCPCPLFFLYGWVFTCVLILAGTCSSVRLRACLDRCVAAQQFRVQSLQSVSVVSFFSSRE